MKWFLPLLLIPTFAFAAKVPVDIFDQSKLETLLRNIPAAFVKSEERPGYVRKYYQFPTTADSEFLIKCQADYFRSSPVPSFKACEVEVNSRELAGDEHLVKISDASTVGAFFGAISYGDEVKKFYSNERVYGQGSDGVYRNLFRFIIICKRNACDLTFVTKEANI